MPHTRCSVSSHFINPNDLATDLTTFINTLALGHTIMDFLRELNRRHEALKHRIHSFRIPLSKTGQRIMGVVYFSIPVIAGYFIMSVRTKECDLILFIHIFMRLVSIFDRLLGGLLRRI